MRSQSLSDTDFFYFMAAWFDIIRRSFTGNRGAATVEFALVLPMLLLVLFGTIEYGWYLAEQSVLANAVSQGARAGIGAREWYDEDPQAMARQALEKAYWLLDNDNENQVEQFRSTIQTAIVDSDDVRILDVAVVALKYRPITGFLPDGLIPNQLSARTVMAFPSKEMN